MTVMEQSIVERFLKSDKGKQIAEGQKQEILAERKEHVEAITKLNTQAELTIPKFRKEFDREGEKVREVEKKLESAKIKHGIAYQKLQAESHSFDTQVSKHEVFLRETYDPAIDKFLREINALIIHCKETAPELLKREQVRESNTLMLKWKPTYDKEGHQKTINKIGEIYEQADAMKLESIEDVPGELEKLREGIPRNSYTSGFEYR